MTNCVEWTGYKNPKGYGVRRFMGVLYYAHRLAWEIENGPIPKGMCICHHCDNPACIKTSHLFVGTQRENLRAEKKQKLK